MLQSIKPKEVEGWDMVCEYCNEEFGLTFFEYTIDQPMCSTCSDADEPCMECGISPSGDTRIKFVCKPCQMKIPVIVKGKDC